MRPIGHVMCPGCGTLQRRRPIVESLCPNCMRPMEDVPDDTRIMLVWNETIQPRPTVWKDTMKDFKNGRRFHIIDHYDVIAIDDKTWDIQDRPRKPIDISDCMLIWNETIL